VTDESVDGPWTTDVDVRDLTDRVLVESRSTSLTVHDPPRLYYTWAHVLSEGWGLSVSEAIDRAVRLFLAHYIDRSGYDLRVEHDVRYSIPPAGWMRDHDPFAPLTAPSKDDLRSESAAETHKAIPVVGETERIDAATTPAVRDIMDSLIVNNDFDSMTEIVDVSLEYSHEQVR